MYESTAETLLDDPKAYGLKGRVQLIFTSPPFPLRSKKRYGNLQGEKYLEWLQDLAPRFRKLLRPNGSIVIELGNAWEPGEPVMSTLAIEALLAFRSAAELRVCQTFVVNNPARLPGPAQWVTVERIRVKDTYTNVWWMAPHSRPKANNRNVLVEYRGQMRDLLARGTYNAGRRPSEHHISRSGFLKDNGGAIPGNVLTMSNTSSTDPYLRRCRELGLTPHPARMPIALAEFFVKFLTDPGDLVFDPFGGSNVTGAAAEKLGRKWVAVEPQAEYVTASAARFDRYTAFDDTIQRVVGND